MRTYHFLSWISVLVITLGLQAGITQTGETLVCTDPVLLEIGAGQIETLQILLVNANNMYGIDLQATFDPAVAEVVDSDSKQSGVQMTSGPFLKPDYTVRNLADNKTGTLRYVVTQLNPTPPASGNGILLVVQFRGKVPGTRSKIAFTSAMIADRRGSRLPVTTQAGELVIVPPKSPTPTSLPSSKPIPATPTLLAATLTQTGPGPTVRPSATPARISIAAGDGKKSVPSNTVLIYITVCGFSGSALLIILSVWLLTTKHRKERIVKSK